MVSHIGQSPIYGGAGGGARHESLFQLFSSHFTAGHVFLNLVLGGKSWLADRADGPDAYTGLLTPNLSFQEEIDFLGAHIKNLLQKQVMSSLNDREKGFHALVPKKTAEFTAILEIHGLNLIQRMPVSTSYTVPTEKCWGDPGGLTVYIKKSGGATPKYSGFGQSRPPIVQMNSSRRQIQYHKKQ